MQSSGISSPATPSQSRSPAGHTRSRFALTGRSAHIDPRVDAARRDLADIRLADRIFAPHYAAPMARSLQAPAPLLSAPHGGEILAELPAGAVFEVLELSGGRAWGTAPSVGLVGYLEADALGEAAA